MRHPRFQHPPLRPPLSLILVGKDDGVGAIDVDINKVTLVRRTQVHPPLRPPLSLILVLGKDHSVGASY